MTRRPAGDIAAHQCIDGIGDLALGQPAHLGDEAGDLLKVLIEGLGGVFGSSALSPPENSVAGLAEATRDIILRPLIAKDW